MNDQPIKVIIVDDYELVRSGLALFMETCENIQLVGQANGGQAGINLCAELQPDVVLMDMVMPDMSGVEATRRIRSQFPHIQVIALTSYDADDIVPEALKAGAIGFLMKNVSIDELSEAIEKAYAGQSALAPEAARVLISSVTAPPTPDYELTERERDVLRLLAQGLSNREIGDELYISRSTVKNHVSNILAKLEVTNRGEAIALAIREGLVN